MTNKYHEDNNVLFVGSGGDGSGEWLLSEAGQYMKVRLYSLIEQAISMINIQRSVYMH